MEGVNSRTLSSSAGLFLLRACACAKPTSVAAARAASIAPQRTNRARDASEPIFRRPTEEADPFSSAHVTLRLDGGRGYVTGRLSRKPRQAQKKTDRRPDLRPCVHAVAHPIHHRRAGEPIYQTTPSCSTMPTRPLAVRAGRRSQLYTARQSPDTVLEERMCADVAPRRLGCLGTPRACRSLQNNLLMPERIHPAQSSRRLETSSHHRQELGGTWRGPLPAISAFRARIDAGTSDLHRIDRQPAAAHDI